MEAVLYPQNKKPIPWRLLTRIAAIAASIIMLIAGFAINAAMARRAQSFEILADVFSIRTALAQYVEARAHYPKPRTPSISLGAGEAVCLDNSPQGFGFTCSHEIFMATVPRSRDGGFYLYSAADAGYTLDFLLPKPIALFADVNKDGKVICRATESAIDCQ